MQREGVTLFPALWPAAGASASKMYTMQAGGLWVQSDDESHEPPA
jgi:hypothetical protein